MCNAENIHQPHLADHDPASDAPEDWSHMLENERALNTLLRTVTNDAPLDEILIECLDILLSVSWLSLLPKAGVFLVQDEAAVLQLVAQRGLSDELLTQCARVPFGKCLCGRAAAGRQLIHTDCVDVRHDISFEGMEPHGHYNVPIMDAGKVVGVMVLYLPHGHPAKQRETQFLTAVADIFSLIIRQKRMEQDLKDAIEKLEKMALIDFLTELHNRRYLIEQLHKNYDEAKRHQKPLSLVMIDLDCFKRINDTHGHAIGDRVLCQTARIIEASVRTYDVSGRIGGEEFCLVLPSTDLSRAADIAERVRSTVEKTPITTPDGALLHFTASMGVAELDHAETPEQALARADTALYAAKRLGRNRVERADILSPGQDKLAV